MTSLAPSATQSLAPPRRDRPAPEDWSAADPRRTVFIRNAPIHDKTAGMARISPADRRAPLERGGTAASATAQDRH